MKILFSKTNYDRKRDFLVQTNIMDEGNKIYAVKKALDRNGWTSLTRSVEFYERFSKKKKKGIILAKVIKKDERTMQVFYEFLEGKTLEALIEQDLFERKFKDALKKFSLLMQLIDQFIEENQEAKIGVFYKFIDDNNIQVLMKKLDNRFVPLTEISADHFIKLAYKEGKYGFFDYENFLNMSIPVKFAKFRAEMYLILKLQRIIRSFASPKFIISSYWKELFIPKDWQRINNFSNENKKLFLYLEEKLQNSLYSYESNISQLNLLDYVKQDVSIRNVERLTHERLNQVNELAILKGSKFYKLWQKYLKIKKLLIHR